MHHTVGAALLPVLLRPAFPPTTVRRWRAAPSCLVHVSASSAWDTKGSTGRLLHTRCLCVSTPPKAFASNAFSSCSPSTATRATYYVLPTDYVFVRAHLRLPSRASCERAADPDLPSATRTHRSGSAVGSAMACGREHRWRGCCHAHRSCAPVVASLLMKNKALFKERLFPLKTKREPLEPLNAGLRRVAGRENRSCCQGLARRTATHSPGPPPRQPRGAAALEIDRLRPQANRDTVRHGRPPCVVCRQGALLRLPHVSGHAPPTHMQMQANCRWRA